MACSRTARVLEIAEQLIVCEEDRMLGAVLIGCCGKPTTRPGAATSPYGEQHGTRLVIAAERSPARPRKDVAELSAILDSIRIEP